MPRNVTVTLDGADYKIPALNLEQLQEVAGLLSGGDPGRTGFAVLNIALRRADPKPNMETLAPELAEIGEAVAEILKLSGLQKPDTNPPLAVVTTLNR